MKREDILKLAFTGHVIGYSTFIYTIFTKLVTDTEYLRKEPIGKDKFKYIFTINGTDYDIEGYDGKGPLFKLTDVLTFTNEHMPIISKPVKTTVWIAILNYQLLYIPFKGRIKFRTINLDIKHIENVTLKQLHKDTPGIADTIKLLSISVSYLRQFADFIVVPATSKTLTPPPDIDKVKKALIIELTKKYGEDPLKSKVGTFDFENRLIEHYKDYMKDDPTYGVITSGKMINIVGKKRFLAIGYEGGFETGEEVNMNESLLDGYPEDRKKLATLFNIARAGSFFRGFETRDAGTTSKELLDATSDLYIDIDDCNVQYGHKMLVTKYNLSVIDDRFIIVNKKVVYVDDANKYIGKIIELRTARYCTAKGGSICKKCVSKSAGRYKEGPTVLALNIGGVLLTAKLKKTHGVANNLREYTITDMLG